MIAKTTQLMTMSAALLILFGAQATVTADNDTPQELEFQNAVPTRIPIVLDGNITDEEWGHAQAIHNPEFYIPKGSGDAGDLVVFEEYNGGIWEGEDDQSTTTRFLYDDENLYVSHLVVDDYHENSANSGWNGDSAQIMIANEDRDIQVALYNFALGGVDGDLGDVIINEEAGPGGVDAVVTRDSETKLTSYEIMLPAASLGLDAPLVPGMLLGFGVAINDGDEFEPGQTGWGGLGAHSIVFGKTPQETIELTLTEATVGGEALQAGDADQNLSFDQFDLVRVQVAAKYLTGLPATWGEGDWNGAPGGTPGNPPAGNGLFDQVDIIAALGAGKYLTGPYAALAGPGTLGDEQTSIVYNPTTGELSVDAPASTELTSINIDSAASIFTGEAALNLGGSFDNDADNNIFKATFGSSFGSLSFGNVAQAGLSEEFVRNDLTVIGSLAGGGDLGNVDLIYVPEPSTVILAAMGALVVLFSAGKRNDKRKEI